MITSSSMSEAFLTVSVLQANLPPSLNGTCIFETEIKGKEGGREGGGLQDYLVVVVD